MAEHIFSISLPRHFPSFYSDAKLHHSATMAHECNCKSNIQLVVALL